MAQYRFNFGAEKTFIDNVSSNAIELINSEGTIKIDNLTITGNLTVDGTTTTINSTTLQVDDKNIELGTVATPSDTTADGGGITLKGATDKTILWTNSTDAWHFNQGINVTSGNVGIGTASPTQGILVLEASSGNVIQRIRDGSNNIVSIGHIDGSGGYLDMMNNAGTLTTSIKTYGDSYFNGGNVGIGTTAPTNLLHVARNSNWQLTLEHTGASSSTDGWILGQLSDGAFGISAENNSDHASSPPLRILTSGNVGIGTTTPANKFHVQDSAYNMQLRVFGCNSLSGITPTGYATHLDFWSRTSTSATTYGRYANIAAHLVDWTNGALKGGLSFSTVNAGTLSTKMYICPSGEVGIGTTTPSSALQVGDGSGSSDNTIVRVVGGTSGYAQYQFGDSADTAKAKLQYYNGDDSLAIHVNNAERMRITNAGNVGIGKTAPTSLLHICGGTAMCIERSGYTGAYVIISNLNSGGDQGLVFGANAYQFRNEDGTACYFTICDDGKVGIGTGTPASTLEVAGTQTWSDGSADPATAYACLNGGRCFTIHAGWGPIWIEGGSDTIFKQWVTDAYYERFKVCSSGTYTTGSIGASTCISATTYLQVGSTCVCQGGGVGTITLKGSGDNCSRIGPYNDDGWMYIISCNNANGMYFWTTQGNFQFDGPGHIISYTDAEVDLGRESCRFRCIYISCTVTAKSASFTHNQTNTVTAQGWCNGSSIAHTSGFGASYRLCNSNDQPNTYNAVDFYTCAGETSPGARIAGVFNVPSLNKSSLSFHVDDSSGLQPRLCLMYDGKNYITGNLGIGCTSPGYKLEVAGETRIAGYLNVKCNAGSAAMGTLYPSAFFLSTNGNCGIGVGADTGINGGGFYPAGGGGARGMSFYNYSGSAWFQQLFLSGNTFSEFCGRLGVGTGFTANTGPLSDMGPSNFDSSATEGIHIRSGADKWAELSVEGDRGSHIRMFDCEGTADKRWFQMSLDASNAEPARFQFKFLNDAGSAAYNIMTLCQDGKVGIGNTAPNQPLSVVSETNNNFNDIASFYTNNKSVGVEIHNMGIRSAHTTADGSTALDTNAPFYVDSKGTGSILIGNQSSGNIILEGVAASSDWHAVRIVNTATNNYEALQIRGANTYDAHMSFRVHSGSAAKYIGMGIDYSDACKFKIGTDNLLASGTNLMTICQTGNVGIGTTSPSSKLEVAGETRIAGCLNVKCNAGSAAMGTLYPSAFFLSTNGNCGIAVGADTGINGGGFYPAGGGGARGMSFYNYTGSAWFQQLFLSGNTYSEFCGRLGVGTGFTVNTGPLSDMGPSNFDSSATEGIHIRSGADKWAELSVEGDRGSHIRMFDCEGTADKRWFQMSLDASNAEPARFQFKFLNDAGSAAYNIMTLCQDGNVGIGTTTPATKLEIGAGANAAASSIRLPNNLGQMQWTNKAGTAQHLIASTYYTSTDDSWNRMLYSTQTTYSMRWYMNDELKMILDKCGNWGLCTAGNQLGGNGNMYLASTNAGIYNCASNFLHGTLGNHCIVFTQNSSTVGAWSSTGLGIGETSPVCKLHIKTTTAQDSHDGIYNCNTTGTASYIGEGANDNTSGAFGNNRAGSVISLHNTDTTVNTYSAVGFYNANSYQTSGIHGVTSVQGTTGTTVGHLEFAVRNAGSNYYIAACLLASGRFCVNDSISTGTVYVGGVGTLNASGGDLQIESAGDDLDIIGSWLRVRDSSGGTVRHQFTIGAAASGYVANSTGNFGVGTTTPDAKLHVCDNDAGTAHYDSNVTSIFESDEARVQVMANDGGNQAAAFILSNQTKHFVLQQRGPSDGNKFTIGYHASSASGEDLPGSDTKLFTICNTGNVGIGTTSPGAVLPLNSDTTNLLEIQSRAANKDSGLRIVRFADDVVGFDMWVCGGASSHDTYFDNRYELSDFIFRSGTRGSGTCDEVMRITGEGNVGIRASSPGGSSTSSPAVLTVCGRTSIIADAGTELQIGGASTYAWMEAWDNSSDRTPKRPIAIQPWGGNVGIGTCSPDADLHVHGSTGSNVYITADGDTNDSDSQTSIWFAHDYDGTKDWAGIIFDGDNKFRINSSGSSNDCHIVINESGLVGIGTDSPGGTLHVSSSASYPLRVTHTSGSQYYFANGVLFTNYSGNFCLENQSGAISLAPNDVVALTACSGCVGIGTTSPDAPLHVHGTCQLKLSRASVGCYTVHIDNIVDTTNTCALTFRAECNGGGFLFQSKTSSGTQCEALSIDRHGSVIVGCAYGSWSKLTVNSGISSSSANVITLIQATNGTPKLAAAIGIAIANGGQNTNAADMYFQTASGGTTATHMTISNGGNVGIGRTDPQGKLDVKSEIRVTNSANSSMTAVKGTYWGYSNGYRALQIGCTGGNDTISMGYDPVTNSGSSFTGNGSEIIFRNGVEFITPNAANNEWHNNTLVMKDGYVGIGNLAPNQPLSVLSHNNNNFDDIASFYTQNKSIGIQIHNKGIGSATTSADGSTTLDANVDFYIDAKGTGSIVLGSQGTCNIKMGLDKTNIIFCSKVANTHINAACLFSCGNFPTTAGHYHNCFGLNKYVYNWNGSGAWTHQHVWTVDFCGHSLFGKNLSAVGDITAYASDCRMKCNILTITCAVDRVKALRGVEFEWDGKYIRDNNLSFTPSEKGKTVGFIAQELENTLPTAVREAPFESSLCREVSWTEKYKTIKAEKIIPLLVEATKEQQSTIEKQQRQIDRLTCQVELLLRKCA